MFKLFLLILLVISTRAFSGKITPPANLKETCAVMLQEILNIENKYIPVSKAKITESSFIKRSPYLEPERDLLDVFRALQNAIYSELKLTNSLSINGHISQIKKSKLIEVAEIFDRSYRAYFYMIVKKNSETQKMWDRHYKLLVKDTNNTLTEIEKKELEKLTELIIESKSKYRINYEDLLEFDFSTHDHLYDFLIDLSKEILN